MHITVGAVGTHTLTENTQSKIVTAMHNGTLHIQYAAHTVACTHTLETG